MKLTNVVPRLALAILIPFVACNKDAESEAQTPTEETPVVAAFAATCTVTESDRSLGVIILRDSEQRCTVFIPEPIDGAELSVALRADAEDRTVAAESLNDEDERLYATDGDVAITIVNGRVTGQVDARDQNAPAVGRIRIAIDAPLP